MTDFVRRSLLLVFLLGGVLAPVSGQSGADREFFDGLLTDLAAVRRAADVPPATRCASRSGSAARLCEGLLMVKRAEFVGDVSEMGRARDLLERTVAEQSKWPVAWYGLAMLRFRMPALDMLSRDGPEQPMGTSSEYGGGLALLRAIAVDSSFTPAIEALAMAPLPREGAGRYTERLRGLRAVRDRLSGVGKLGAALIEYEAGFADSSAVLLREVLRDRSVDRGMVRLSLARSLYRIGQSGDAKLILLAGASDTSTASRLAYRQLLAFTATPDELTAWDTLSTAARGPWFAAFWSARDALQGWPDGARLVEHFRRTDYALANYLLKEAQQGQQVVSPLASPRRLDPGRDEVSARYFSELRDKVLAANADTLQATALMANAAIEAGQYQAPFRTFRAFRERLDDRGTLYIRYGEPAERIETAWNEGTAQLWVYHLPDQLLTIAFRSEEFSGNAGATRMVPHLLDLPEQARTRFCTIRPKLCMPVSDETSMILLIREEATDGYDNIKRVTTTDDHHRTYAKPMSPSLQVTGIDKLAGGESSLLVAFAIPGDQLAYTTPPEAGGRAIYPLRIQFGAIRDYDGRRVSLDTLRFLAMPAPLGKGELLSGVIELPLDPARYTGSIILTQNEEKGAGAVAQIQGVVVPDHPAGLSLSALVFGKAGSGVEWNSGSKRVPLNPLNTFTQGSDASVYYQVRGMVPDQSYAVTFEFFPEGKTERVFSVTATEEAKAERDEFLRTIAFPDTAPGRYRVVVTMKGPAGEVVTATAGLMIVKP